MKKDPSELRLYAVARLDLKMSPGKLAAQCGHAFVDTFKANASTLERGRRLALWHGHKVVLGVGSQNDLFTIQEKARAAGLPQCLVEDSGLTEFERPEFTALGIGPALLSEVPFLSHLKLYR